MLYAIGVLLIASYAICIFAIYLASLRGIALEGSFLTRAITALSDPMTSGGVVSFMYLGIYASAANLGLTNLPDMEGADEL